jgi:hypothetical protein
MVRPKGVVQLACVCLLLVMVAGAAESGNVAGFNYAGFPFASLFRALGAPSSLPNGSQGTTTTTQTSNSSSGGPKMPPLPKLPPLPNLPGITPFAVAVAGLPVWLLASAGAVCLIGASLLILRRGTDVSVHDLNATLEEMEEQRRYLEETWSYRLRNAALLKYYLLMRRACVKVGLRDEDAETPQEYIGRVSAHFEVDGSEAARFASAVNRSRYGEELSEPDAKEASALMGVFADAIRRRAGEIP